MFNIRRNKIAVDFTQPTKPNQVPGETIEEKAAYISEMLSEKLAEDFKAGRISEEQIYKLVADKSIQAESDFAFLEQYRLNIEELRKLAGKLIKSQGISQPNELAIDSIIQKLLERAGSYFVPQLIKLHRVDTRTEELVTPLLSYKKPEEIAAIRNFIRVEVLKRRLAVEDEFKVILKKGKLFNPAFNEEQLIFILENELSDIAQNESIVLSPVQVQEIKEELTALDKKVLMMNSKARLWNRILELHPDIPNKEEWAALIPDELRITWTLKAILRYFDYDVSGTDELRRRIKETTDSPKIRAEQSDSLYFYFFPDTDEYEKPLVIENDKRAYALRKLRECVENGYDNERIFGILGLSIRSAAKKKSESEKPEEEVEVVEDDSKVSVADSNDKYVKRIAYWYKYQVRKGSATSALDASTRLSAFRSDLREAGLPEVAELLGKVFEKPEDKRYSDFDLKFLSNEEKNLCEMLRNEYGLDPIPFPVKIPCPVDNPTTFDRFEIDFLLPCDVLVGFEEEETINFINEETGEVETSIIRKPIIEHRIIFVGEYFGIRYTDKKTLEDKGRPYVTPEGEIPVYRYNQGKPNEKIYVLAAGSQCRTLEFYKLKTSWKIFTTEIIADMLGTRTLSFDDTELMYKKPLMKKLDAARIIYSSPNCEDKNGCLALKEIKEKATLTPEVRKYVEPNLINQRFEDIKHRSLNIVECAIVNVKLSEALMQSKREFVSQDVSAKPGFFNEGFNRQTMHNHKVLFDQKKNRLEFLEKQLSVKADSETFRKVNDLRQEIRTMISSPLYNFKQFLDQTLSEGPIGEKIKNLQELKNLIETDQIKPSLAELRRLIVNISPDLLGQLQERGVGDE